MSNIMPNAKYICAVAGKSGGHIVPAMTYVQNFLKSNPDYKVLFFSTDTKLDKSIIALYPIELNYVPLKLDNVPSTIWQYPKFIFDFIKSFFVSFKHLYKTKPDRVVSMGGYISIPISLAAWILSIPIELFSLDAVPGKAGMKLASYATKINVCFEKALKYFPKDKTQLVDYPLRFTSADIFSKEDARLHLGLDPKKKTLLVLGGSQGSKFLNDIVAEFAESVKNKVTDFQIIHQTGGDADKHQKEIYDKLNIQSFVFGYYPNLQYCYSAADLCLARAGAGTLFELAFFKTKSLIIPLEAITTSHQLDNAYAIVKQYPQQFSMIRQDEVEKNKQHFFNEISLLLQI